MSGEFQPTEVLNTRHHPRDVCAMQVHLRDMGTYNDTLLGDILSDFAPLQSTDILLVSPDASE